MGEVSRSLTAACVYAGVMALLSGCVSSSGNTSRDITADWKRYFAADDHPANWHDLGEGTERVLLADNYLTIDGTVDGCDDARGYWLMGLEWKKEKDTEVSRFITVYADDKLVGDTTTTGEFDCHIDG